MSVQPQRRELSEGLRGEIIGMRKVKTSFAEIGRLLEIDESTARKVWNRYQETGTYESAERSGRPAKLNDHDCRQLVRYIRHDRETRREPLQEIAATLNLNVSARTLERKLTIIGLGHYIERKKPFLTQKQKAARLKFAKNHIHWHNDEWRRVGWTDEMSMQTGVNQGKVWVWRYPEEEYYEDCMAATHIPGFKKVKFWGAMRYGKLSAGIILSEKKGDGKMNAEEYLEEIMDKELFDFWITGMEEVGYLLIMEDGAPYHQGVASIRRKQLEKDGFVGWGPGVWPSNSPDLNPIENLWHILRTNVRNKHPLALTKKDLIIALKEEWAKLDINIINDLCDSMPRRLAAVIAAKGGSMKY